MSNWQKIIIGKVATGFLSGGTPTTPRLISGKLSVEDLDIQIPPSMREGA